MTTIDRGDTPTPTGDPVQTALTALVSAAERVQTLTGEYTTHAQTAALRGGQVPQVVAEQTLHALIGFSTALGAFEAAAATPAPRLELRQAQHILPGDTIHIHNVGAKTVAFRAVLPPEGVYYGGGWRFTFTDGTDRTWPRLARLHVEPRPGPRPVDDYFDTAPIVAEPCPVPGCPGRLDGSGCDFGIHEMARQADLARLIELDERMAYEEARADAEGDRS